MSVSWKFCPSCGVSASTILKSYMSLEDHEGECGVIPDASGRNCPIWPSSVLGEEILVISEVPKEPVSRATMTFRFRHFVQKEDSPEPLDPKKDQPEWGYDETCDLLGLYKLGLECDWLHELGGWYVQRQF